MTPTTINVPTRINWKVVEINLGSILTIGACLVTMAVAWGVLTNRTSNNEAAIADVRANVADLRLTVKETNISIQSLAKETNLSIQNLANVAFNTKTLVDERTHRAEVNTSANSAQIRRQQVQVEENTAEIDKNRATIATKQDTAKKKSLAKALGLSK